MKKYLTILFMLGIVAALVLWWSPELRQDADDLLGSSGLKSGSDTLYKWQNKQGVWQYTQEQPPEGTPYQTIDTHADTNVLPLPEQLRPRD